MDNALVPCTLEVINMTAAEEQYKDFVDVSNAELTISQFKTKRGLPLNEQYFSIREYFLDLKRRVQYVPWRNSKFSQASCQIFS